MEALVGVIIGYATSIVNTVGSIVNTVGKYFEVQTSQNIEDAAYYNNSSANINALAGISIANSQVEATAIAQKRAATLYATLIVLAVIASVVIITLKTKK